MKKIVVLFVAVFALGFAASAQDAIGLRFGGGSSYGAEISYQKGLGSNRAEFDLGANLPDLNFFYLAGVYQWRGEITDWLSWFAGPGAKAQSQGSPDASLHPDFRRSCGSHFLPREPHSLTASSCPLPSGMIPACMLAKANNRVYCS